MKKLAKVLSLALVLVMVLSLGGTAWAENVTIKANDEAEHTFKAYQIFAGDVAEKKLSNIRWGTGVDVNALVDAIIPHFKDRTETAACMSDSANLATIRAYYNISDETENITIGTIFSALNNDADKAAIKDNPTKLEQAFFDAFGEQGKDTAAGKILAQLLVKFVTIPAKEQTGKGSIVLANLDPGYYLIQEATTTATIDGAYSLIITNVVGENIEIAAKSSVPSVEKKVKENDYTNNDLSSIGKDKDGKGVPLGAGYNDVADYNIGDDVPFELFGTLPSNYADYDAFYYEFVDTMDAALTFDNTSVKVFYTNNKVTAESTVTWNEIAAAENHYTVTSETLTGEDAGKTRFSVKFNIVGTRNTDGTYDYTASGSDKGLKDIEGIDSNSVIKVEYKAKLNKNAVIGLPGQINKVKLVFSNNPNKTGYGERGQTPEDQVIVFTYELDSTKYANSVGDSNKLRGAQFVLTKQDAENNTVYYKEGTDSTMPSWVKITAPAETMPQSERKAYFEAKGATVFESDENGKITEVKGLDKGTYKLVEICPPAGYNTASDTVITVTSGKVMGQEWNGTPATALPTFKYTVNDVEKNGKTNEDNDAVMDVAIVDMQGSVLPTTGGVGTTLFYVFGSMLVIAAAVYFVTKKRSEVE